MQDYKLFLINKYINRAILYKDNSNSLTLPYLAREQKRRRKNIDKVRLQSAYNRVALIYIRKQALFYFRKANFSSYTKIITFTIDSTNLNLYIYYTTLLENSTFKYYQYSITLVNLLKSC